MSTKTLLAAALATSFAVPFTAGATTTPVVIKTWSDPPMPVEQLMLPEGIQKCHFGQGLPTGAGFGVSQFADGQITIFLGRAGSWSKGGKVSLTVDGGAPFVATAVLRPIASQPGASLLGIDIPNEGAGRDFLHDLWNGQTLYVAAGPMQAAFSLYGSATALGALHACAAAIGAPPPAPLPASTPVVPPPPTTVATTPSQPYSPQEFSGSPAVPPQAFVAKPPSSNVSEATLINDGGSLQVDAMVNDQPVRFLVDSGATGVTLPQPVADRLFRAGALSVGDFKTTVETTLADGSHRTTQGYLLRAITVGGITVRNVPAFVGGNGDPLLGLSFLSRLSSWSIDNKRNMLVMGPPT
jgi:clan AA aspartic protease (TIGR02281 family)